MSKLDLGRSWLGAIIMGGWLAAVSVWPTMELEVKYARFLCQPFLILTLVFVTAARSRRVGWSTSAAQSLWMYAVLGVSAWLPYLRPAEVIPAPPAVYGVYIVLYEILLAALIGYQAVWIVRGTSGSWWVADGWSRPLVVAPVLLLLRGAWSGTWPVLAVGISLGVFLVLSFHRWKVPFKTMMKSRWFLPLAVFLLGAVLVYGSGLRIYFLEGNSYPNCSDDGFRYFLMAVNMANDPSIFWHGDFENQNYFTVYYVAMALWFLLVGTHIPSWLLWHGFAGGLLAWLGFWFGRRLGGNGYGLLMAGFFVMDRIILQLMATMNMETFFIPLLYLSILLWISAGDRPSGQEGRMGFFAGLVLGLATVFRPTSILVPLIFLGLMCVERPRKPWKSCISQGGWMLVGMAIPVILLMIRHRIAWGYWTLWGRKMAVSSGLNYALKPPDSQHFILGPWQWLGETLQNPSYIFGKLVPGWWDQGLVYWTHPGFGQMDLIQGFRAPGFYQMVFASILAIGVILGAARAFRNRSRLHLLLLALPLYFSSFVFLFYVVNSRYRSPFIPALYLLACIGFLGALKSRPPGNKSALPTQEV